MPTAVAADDEKADEAKVDDEAVNEQVLVTATRLADKVGAESEVAAHVTIVDREQIAASGARNLQDLLSEKTGVVLIDQVGNNVQKSLDLRGFSGGEGVAVFVDGTRINDPRNNLASLEQVPLDAVERVEVIRGPSAALAGGGAEAGVIRVITRRGTQPTASVSASGGTWDTARLTPPYGAQFGRVRSVRRRAPTTRRPTAFVPTPEATRSGSTCRAESTSEWTPARARPPVVESRLRRTGRADVGRVRCRSVAERVQPARRLEHGPATGVADVPGAGRRRLLAGRHARLPLGRRRRRSRPGVRRR